MSNNIEDRSFEILIGIYRGYLDAFVFTADGRRLSAPRSLAVLRRLEAELGACGPFARRVATGATTSEELGVAYEAIFADLPAAPRLLELQKLVLERGVSDQLRLAVFLFGLLEAEADLQPFAEHLALASGDIAKARAAFDAQRFGNSDARRSLLQ